MSSWLIDKSALVRLPHHPDREDWAGRVSRGMVRVSTITLLEVGFSARDGEGWVRLVDGPPVAQMPVELVTPAAERRVMEVQGQLARRGLHRAPSIPDLFVAAVAEKAGLTVLHVDKDFELIAQVTGQPVERLA